MVSSVDGCSMLQRMDHQDGSISNAGRCRCFKAGWRWSLSCSIHMSPKSDDLTQLTQLRYVTTDVPAAEAVLEARNAMAVALCRASS